MRPSGEALPPRWLQKLLGDVDAFLGNACSAGRGCGAAYQCVERLAAAHALHGSPLATTTRAEGVLWLFSNHLVIQPVEHGAPQQKITAMIKYSDITAVEHGGASDGCAGDALGGGYRLRIAHTVSHDPGACCHDAGYPLQRGSSSDIDECYTSFDRVGGEDLDVALSDGSNSTTAAGWGRSGVDPSAECDHTTQVEYTFTLTPPKAAPQGGLLLSRGVAFLWRQATQRLSVREQVYLACGGLADVLSVVVCIPMRIHCSMLDAAVVDSVKAKVEAAEQDLNATATSMKTSASTAASTTTRPGLLSPLLSPLASLASALASMWGTSARGVSGVLDVSDHNGSLRVAFYPNGVVAAPASAPAPGSPAAQQQHQQQQDLAEPSLMASSTATAPSWTAGTPRGWRARRPTAPILTPAATATPDGAASTLEASANANANATTPAPPRRVSVQFDASVCFRRVDSGGLSDESPDPTPTARSRGGYSTGDDVSSSKSSLRQRAPPPAALQIPEESALDASTGSCGTVLRHPLFAGFTSSRFGQLLLRSRTPRHRKPAFMCSLDDVLRVNRPPQWWGLSSKSAEDVVLATPSRGPRSLATTVFRIHGGAPGWPPSQHAAADASASGDLAASLNGGPAEATWYYGDFKSLLRVWAVNCNSLVTLSVYQSMSAPSATPMTNSLSRSGSRSVLERTLSWRRQPSMGAGFRDPQTAEISQGLLELRTKLAGNRRRGVQSKRRGFNNAATAATSPAPATADGVTANDETQYSLNMVLSLLSTFDKMDGSRNALIDEDEFIAHLGPALRRDVSRAVFRVFNVTGTGDLTFAEFLYGHRLLRMGSMKDRIHYLYSIFDVGRTGVISFNEFFEVMTLLHDITAHSMNVPKDQPFEDYCRELFQRVDDDGSGEVDLDEFRAALAEHADFREALDWALDGSGNASTAPSSRTSSIYTTPASYVWPTEPAIRSGPGSGYASNDGGSGDSTPSDNRSECTMPQGTVSFTTASMEWSSADTPLVINDSMSSDMCISLARQASRRPAARRPRRGVRGSGKLSASHEVVSFGSKDWLMVTTILAGVQRATTHRAQVHDARVLGDKAQKAPLDATGWPVMEAGVYDAKIVWNLTTGEQVDAFPKLRKPDDVAQTGDACTPANCTPYFADYAPEVFDEIMAMAGVTRDGYLHSLGITQLQIAMLTGAVTSLVAMQSSSKSGSFFFLSHDQRYVLKTIPQAECDTFLRSMKGYHMHLRRYPGSLLTRVLGLHRLQFGDMGVIFMVMQNVLYSPLPIDTVYDLKGSTIGRSTADEKKRPGLALKDLDLRNDPERQGVVRMPHAALAQLMHHIRVDSLFLRDCHVMDYSLLLGIHKRGAGGGSDDIPVAPPDTLDPLRNYCGGCMSPDGREVYYVGMIDFLTYYGVRKQAEHGSKALLYLRNSDGVSCTDPAKYQRRFVDAMGLTFHGAASKCRAGGIVPAAAVPRAVPAAAFRGGGVRGRISPVVGVEGRRNADEARARSPDPDHNAVSPLVSPRRHV